MLCILVGVIVAHCAWAQSRPVETPREKVWRLHLVEIIREPELGAMQQELEGLLRTVDRPPEPQSFELTISKIARKFSRPETEQQALRMAPCTVAATFSRDERVPAKLRMVSGGLSDDQMALTTQYRTAYLLLDLVLATAPNGTMKALGGRKAEPLTFVVTKPKEMHMPEFGTCTLSDMTAYHSPKEFFVAPVTAGETVKEIALHSFTSDSLNFDYSYRCMSALPGIAHKAVSISATRPIVAPEAARIPEIVAGLANPKNFESYHSYEVSLEPVP